MIAVDDLNKPKPNQAQAMKGKSGENPLTGRNLTDVTSQAIHKIYDRTF